MNPSQSIARLNENRLNWLTVDLEKISNSELARLGIAIQQNTSVTILRFKNASFNAEATQSIAEALRKNTAVQEIYGIEFFDISKLLVKNRYFAAKKQLQDICCANNDYGKAIRKNNPTYEHSFKDAGLKIIAYIEELRAEDLEKTEVLTETLNALSEFLIAYQDVKNIDQVLGCLKSKIDSDDYKQLRARICVFVGLFIMFVSIATIAFCIITGNVFLLPFAAVCLSFLVPILAGSAMLMDEAGIHNAYEDSQLVNYFYTGTTPEREDDRQVCDILQQISSSI